VTKEAALVDEVLRGRVAVLGSKQTERIPLFTMSKVMLGYDPLTVPISLDAPIPDIAVSVFIG
jgi:hypothetical protein